MTSSVRLLLVGCGKMGSALLERTLVSHLASDICVVEPTLPTDGTSHTHLKWLSSPSALDAGFTPDILILAVKPQQMANILPSYARFKNAVFLSIAAGVTISQIQAMLGNNATAVVRSMPNLPARIGMGMSVAVASQTVSQKQRDLCDRFLKAIGETAWIENEDLLDAVTALSGSGPAYLFALCEAMATAGETLGLSPDLAAQLARQTIIGSGALLAHSSDSAESLRKAVTSPGGTTDAALKELLAREGLPTIILKAMKAAVARAKDLAS